MLINVKASDLTMGSDALSRNTPILIISVVTDEWLAGFELTVWFPQTKHLMRV